MTKVSEKKLEKLKESCKKVEEHKNRVFSKVDDEMYLISKSESNKKEENIQQKNLAVLIMVEFLEVFEEEEVKEILGRFKEIFE